MITFFDSQLATGSTPKNGDASGCEVVEKWGYVIDRIEDSRARPASKFASNDHKIAFLNHFIQSGKN